MSKKRNLSSQQSIDTIIKLNPNLRNELLEQLESFNLVKNNELLDELKNLLEFRNKKIKDQKSYLEINICQIEKIVDLLIKLDAFHRLKNPSNDLKLKLNNMKEVIIEELIMLPAKLYLEFETDECINPNYDQYYINYESNNFEPNNYESNDLKLKNEPNYYESNNYEPNYYESNNYESNNYEPNYYESNNYESNNYEPNNYEPNNFESNNEPNNETNNEQNNVPNDCDTIISLIFKELSIQDLLTCRLVNKLFKHFSDHTNGINKLIIGQPDWDTDHYWIHNSKLIEDKDMISLKCFRTIQKLSIFNLDKYLKYLKIYDQEFKLKEISNLINLECIEFGSNYANNNQQILNLNNLRTFVSDSSYLQLNTPKLEKIQFYDINDIRLNSNAESIKHLITHNYDNKFEIFKNLEIMELRYTNQLYKINENLLIKFKNLKQLKINLNELNYSNERMKNSLIKILIDKIKLKRSIDIYLEGIKIENIDKFNELVSIKYCELWKFRLNNYDLLDLNVPFIGNLNYKELERFVYNIKNNLPSSFFDKFFYINYVKVDSVLNVDGLNWFLNKLKYLRRLDIGSKVSVGEVFYNNLPNKIKELNIQNREDINYEFILKLPKLDQFYTSVNRDLFDLAFKSFSTLKNLNDFRFYFKDKAIRIKKENNYFYLNNRIMKLDYNQLIEVCNEIRSK